VQHRRAAGRDRHGASRPDGEEGAVPGVDSVAAYPDLIEDLEANGLVYFDDFFEMSGNWPAWLTLYARGIRGAAT